ncbi:MAG: hypothetical protein E6I96_00100 [Chloroflexi bacterium]|nr:MAG: hypothetical protein E6I96_00100 [Chloroflexota bacterium]
MTCSRTRPRVARAACAPTRASSGRPTRRSRDDGVGFHDPEEFRRLTYIAALMRCFPGRNRQDTGDLAPPPAGIANCAHWLDAELGLLKPKVIILVGQMAISRFLGRAALEDRVGKAFGARPVMIPLPHPSGQNRWLNAPANRDRLARALALISEQRSNLAG